MQWEDKKIEDNNRSLLFKARLKNILIKEIVSFSLDFSQALFRFSSILKKHNEMSYFSF